MYQLRLHQFADTLSNFNRSSQPNDMNWWRKFVTDFYSPTGLLRQQLVNPEKNETKQFEVPTALLARYYYTLFESGVQRVEVVLQQMVENQRQPGAAVIVDCKKCSFIYWFENGVHVSHHSVYFVL